MGYAIRELTAADKAAALALSAKIWEGDDYVPRCFDAWLAEGGFLGCFAAGRLVGFGKLSFLGSGQAWLEGLRKDPDAGVGGVGKALCEHSLRLLARAAAAEPGAIESVRFSTYIENAASIKINEGIGFRRVADFTIRTKAPRPAASLGADAERLPSGPTGGGGSEGLSGADGDVSLRPLRDAGAAWEALRAAGWLRDFLCYSWRAWPEREGRGVLAAACAAGRCVEALDGAGRRLGLVAWELDLLKGVGVVLGLAAERADAAARLLGLAEAEALDAGLAELEAMVPHDPALLGLFDAAGWEGWGKDRDFLVYELPLEVLVRYA